MCQSIRVHRLRADPIAYAAKSTDTRFALVKLVSLELHQVVGLNVLLVPNVPWTRLALIKNAKIRVREHADKMHVVRSSTIALSVAVLLALPGIPSLGVYRKKVSMFILLSCLQHVTTNPILSFYLCCI